MAAPPPPPRHRWRRRPHLRAAVVWLESWLESNAFSLSFAVVYAAANAVAFYALATPEWRRRAADRAAVRWLFSAGRGAGAVLTLNAAAVILLAARLTMTALRGTVLNLFLPLDAAMPTFHSVVGVVGLAAAAVHTAAHVARYATVGTIDWRGGLTGTTSLFITGMLLVAVLAALVAVAAPRVRRGHYELFYVVHVAAAAAFFPLLFLHGVHRGTHVTYRYVLPPLLLYAADKALLAVRTVGVTVSLTAADVVSVPGAAGSVLRLSLPRAFPYLAGQYAQVCVPAISRTQWHPFTIASAPHEAGMTFYIARAGAWTAALHDLLAEGGGDGGSRGGGGGGGLSIRIRGPYGAPAQHWGQFEQVLLVGGGVGATPFVAITKDIHHRLKGAAAVQRDAATAAAAADDREWRTGGGAGGGHQLGHQPAGSGPGGAAAKVQPPDGWGKPWVADVTEADGGDGSSATDGAESEPDVEARAGEGDSGLAAWSPLVAAAAPPPSARATRGPAGGGGPPDRSASWPRRASGGGLPPPLRTAAAATVGGTHGSAVSVVSSCSSVCGGNGSGVGGGGSFGCAAPGEEPEPRLLDRAGDRAAADEPRGGGSGIDDDGGVGGGGVTDGGSAAAAGGGGGPPRRRRPARILALQILHSVLGSMLLVWTVAIRYTLVAMALIFGALSPATAGTGLYRYPALTAVDLVLSAASAIPLTASVLLEAHELGPAAYFRHWGSLVDCVFLLPISWVNVITDVLYLATRAGASVSWWWIFDLAFLWPGLFGAYSFRLHRVIGARVALAERPPAVTGGAVATTRVDFLWTAKTPTDDAWLVEELWPLVADDDAPLSSPLSSPTGGSAASFRHRSPPPPPPPPVTGGGDSGGAAADGAVHLHRYLTRAPPAAEPWMASLPPHAPLRTHYGRPAWTRLLAATADRCPSGTTVGIFFCGPPAMAADVRSAAAAAMRRSIAAGLSRGVLSAAALHGDGISSNLALARTASGTSAASSTTASTNTTATTGSGWSAVSAVTSVGTAVTAVASPVPAAVVVAAPAAAAVAVGAAATTAAARRDAAAATPAAAAQRKADAADAAAEVNAYGLNVRFCFREEKFG